MGLSLLDPLWRLPEALGTAAAVLFGTPAEAASSPPGDGAATSDAAAVAPLTPDEGAKLIAHLIDRIAACEASVDGFEAACGEVDKQVQHIDDHFERIEIKRRSIAAAASKIARAGGQVPIEEPEIPAPKPEPTTLAEARIVYAARNPAA